MFLLYRSPQKKVKPEKKYDGFLQELLFKMPPKVVDILILSNFGDDTSLLSWESGSNHVFENHFGRGFIMFHHRAACAPLKFSIDTQHDYIWKEMHFEHHHFLVSMLNFPGVPPTEHLSSVSNVACTVSLQPWCPLVVARLVSTGSSIPMISQTASLGTWPGVVSMW